MNGDVKLKTVTYNFWNGKNIRKRFINGSEEDSWWKTGHVMKYDSKDISGDFTVIFFLMKAYKVNNETPISFNKVLKLPLTTDYLNHDLHLLVIY